MACRIFYFWVAGYYMEHALVYLVSGHSRRASSRQSGRTRSDCGRLTRPSERRRCALVEEGAIQLHDLAFVRRLLLLHIRSCYVSGLASHLSERAPSLLAER